MTVLPMAKPIYRRRIGEDSRVYLQRLEEWVNGRRIHPYGLTALERYGVEAMHEKPGELVIEGKLIGLRMRWMARAVQCGDVREERYVWASGHSDPDDAARVLLELIEEDEREEWEAALVVGLA